MRGVAVSLMLLLVACGATPTMRDQSAPFSSIALFDAEKFSGVWFEVASFTDYQHCPARVFNYQPAAPATFDVFRVCPQRIRELPTIGRAKIIGPGRIKQSIDGGPKGELWVLWVDADYRTAVIAARNGKEAWILDRSSRISEDRLNVAEEVLRFNGYDPEKLIRFAGEAA